MDSLRVVVFREEDLYVAQCLEHDISVQAQDLNALMDRLDLALEAECALSAERSGGTLEHIAPAPNYFHALWDKGSLAIRRLNVPIGSRQMEFKLAA
jgi:hypothetical protein